MTYQVQDTSFDRSDQHEYVHDSMRKNVELAESFDHRYRKGGICRYFRQPLTPTTHATTKDDVQTVTYVIVLELRF